MRDYLKTAIIILAGLALAGCYFTSKTNLVPPELRVDPFDDAGAYLMPEKDGSPSEEALLRLPDSGFLGIVADRPADLTGEVTRYDFAAIEADLWAFEEDEDLPGAPYLTSMCEVEPLDAVAGCYIYMIFIRPDGGVTSVAPSRPEGGPDSVELTSFEAAVLALRDAWRAGDVETEDMPAFESLTPDRAEELGFQPPRFE